ncbi:hypothetical protein G6F43_004578 [Rhizopus delemar]|nr:hypothetical protein G6F43_004578 [Rhizopus delemar]
MSFLSPISSPSRRRRYEALKEAPWTVDNSDSRILRFDSTPKSILKGTYTPSRYEHEQRQDHRQQVRSRRVSFAPAANLRLFNHDDTIEYTLKSVDDLFAQPEPESSNELLNTPKHYSINSSSLSKLSGSPSDRRKRRRDLFGTPPGIMSNERSHIGEHVSLEEGSDDEEEESHLDMTHFLAESYQKNAKNLFAEDDDNDHEDEEEIKMRSFRNPFNDESTMRDAEGYSISNHEDDSQTDDKSMFGSSSINGENEKNEKEREEEDMIVDFEPEEDPLDDNNNGISERDTLNIDDIALNADDIAEADFLNNESIAERNPLIDYNIEEENEQQLATTNIHLAAENVNNRESVFEDDDVDMQITQEITYNKQPSLSQDSAMQLTQEVVSQEITRLQEPQYLLDTHASVMMHTQEINNQTAEQLTAVGDESEMQITQEISMEITQESFYRTSTVDNIAASTLPSLKDHDTFSSSPKATRGLMQNDSPQPRLYEANSDDPEQITLKDFLDIFGITFSKEKPLNHIKRIVDYNHGPTTIIEQVTAATFTLPQLETYQSIIQQMESSIQTSHKVAQEIEIRVNKSNPSFFFDYSIADVETRHEKESEYRLAKQHAEKKSLERWYEWWSNALKEHLTVLYQHRDRLNQDKHTLIAAENRLSEQLPKILDHQKRVSKLYAVAREKEKEYHSFDHIKLSTIITEIEQQRLTIASFKADLDRLKRKKSELLEQTDRLEKRKSELLDLILETEKVIEENQKVTEQDLIEAQKEYERSCLIQGWRLMKDEKNMTELMIGQDVMVSIDREKLAQKMKNAVRFELLASKEKELGQLSELKRGLYTVINNKWDMNEITQAIVIYWNRVKMIADIIRNTRLHFRIRIDLIKADKDEDSGIQCCINASSAINKTMITAIFNIRVKDLLSFPYIDLSSIHIQVDYGDLEANELKEQFKKTIGDNGALELVDSIKHLLQ